MRARKNPWLRLGFESYLLGAEACSVIAMRAAKFATGAAAANAEAHRMVSEKVQATFALQAAALTGRLGFTPHGAARKGLAHYRRKVRANRRRLAK